jgi:hypothetical protein
VNLASAFAHTRSPAIGPGALSSSRAEQVRASGFSAGSSRRGESQHPTRFRFRGAALLRSHLRTSLAEKKGLKLRRHGALAGFKLGSDHRRDGRLEPPRGADRPAHPAHRVVIWASRSGRNEGGLPEQARRSRPDQIGRGLESDRARRSRMSERRKPQGRRPGRSETRSASIGTASISSSSGRGWTSSSSTARTTPRQT